MLGEAGYATAHFGKWHLGSGDSAPSPGEYAIDDHRTANSSGPSYDERDPYFRARSTGLFVDDTIRFIEECDDQPFYVNLWTLIPHATLHPTDEQLEPYARFAPAGVPYNGAAQIYYATVTNLDAELGRLFAYLHEAGLAENTIILFTSDNGPEDIHVRNAAHSGIGSAGPFRGRKRSLYDGGVRVPFIVRWPGHVPAGRIDETSIVTAVDFLPTLCHIAGVALPENYASDGENVADMLRGESRPRTTPLRWEWRFRVAGYPYHHSPILAVRDGDWKLLLNPDGSRVELYNVPADPMELSNLADQHPDLVERLSQMAIDWQAELPPGPIDDRAGQINYGWPR
jgi:N-acetylgalactosamine-6-sulfatase